jgi:hypothetical protein
MNLGSGGFGGLLVRLDLGAGAASALRRFGRRRRSKRLERGVTRRRAQTASRIDRQLDVRGQTSEGIDLEGIIGRRVLAGQCLVRGIAGRGAEPAGRIDRQLDVRRQAGERVGSNGRWRSDYRRWRSDYRR